MLTETMERRPEIGFASYDRFFPSQDTMPVGGFANLIAFPLQRRARELERRRRLARHGGHLTAAEQSHLNSRLNHNSGRVYNTKHNAPTQPGA